MIRAVQLCKDYHMGDSVVHALDHVDLEVDAGEFVSIVGASGSGKSTLMHILGCLDRPTAGMVEFNGEQISALSDRQLARVRNQNIGFVFQTFNLINRTTALDNVIIPLVYTRKSFSKSTARAALARVGLDQRAKHRPSEMSGGECQRVAIARAIVNNPQVVLADEPTGNLDSRTGLQIMQVFQELNAAGITIVLVTHEMEIAVQADRMIRMRDGRVEEDTAVDDRRREEILLTSQDAQKRIFRQKAAAKREQDSANVASETRTIKKGR
ncbi:MAG: ABC transporter ATP-binding protein [Planctomycetota bacterium]|jgi:putative ABC transport system ATP-binding protein